MYSNKETNFPLGGDMHNVTPFHISNVYPD